MCMHGHDQLDIKLGRDSQTITNLVSHLLSCFPVHALSEQVQTFQKVTQLSNGLLFNDWHLYHIRMKLL